MTSVVAQIVYAPKEVWFMGKVFMWEEIKNGMIPELNSFERVVTEIKSRLEDAPLIGGVICGSVNYGHHNVRSDIDCLVLYPEEAKPEMVNVLLSLTEFAEELYVPIDFIQVTPELAQTSIQNISPSMAQHIQGSTKNGGLIKTNPFARMTLHHLDDRLEAINWIRQKIRRLDEGAIHRYPPREETQYLQKLLEAPIHGTRKLLLTNGGFENDSKTAVVGLTEEYFPELADDLRHFGTVDRFYTEKLLAQIKFPDEDEYKKTLSTVRAEGERLSQYLKKVGQLLEG